MKIIYISKSIIPSRTANSIHVMKMCQALSDCGHEVVLLAPNQKNEYQKEVKNIYDYYDVSKNFVIKKLWHPEFKAGALIYTLAIFYYLLINKDFNLVYGRFLHGCFVATFFRKNVIFESHENITKMKSHRLFIFKRLIASKYFKKLIVISQALKNIYLKNGYLSNDKIHVAHDGADEVKNSNNKIELSGNIQALKVGYVGHLYKGRGIELIIECAKRMKEITFHIVGGTSKDINYWKSYIKDLGLFNIFLYGFVTPKETVRYRNSFDILLAPYAKKVSVYGVGDQGDTSQFMSPLKIFEYMSHKKAIIASDLPVIREVLNSDNSMLIKPENINDLVNSISFLKNKENRKKIANKALNDFEKYSWKNRAIKLMSII